MATTYSSSRVASTVNPRTNINMTYDYATYEASVALVLNDVIQMVPVAAGARVLDVICSVDDLDSGASIVIDVGDGTTSGRFISGQTIAQGGGTVRLGAGITGAAAADAAAYLYSAEDTIDIKVTTAPAGGGTGTLKLVVVFGFHG